MRNIGVILFASSIVLTFGGPGTAAVRGLGAGGPSYSMAPGTPAVGTILHGTPGVPGPSGAVPEKTKVKTIRTPRQCFNNCSAGGMRWDFCVMSCYGY